MAIPGLGRSRERGHVAVTEDYVPGMGDVVREWHDVHGEEAEKLIRDLKLHKLNAFQDAKSFGIAEVFVVEDPSIPRLSERRSRRSHWHPERPLP